MTRLSKVGSVLVNKDERSKRVQAVEQELGLPKLEPEYKALYKAVFKKLKSGAVPTPTPTPTPAPALPGEEELAMPTEDIQGGF